MTGINKMAYKAIYSIEKRRVATIALENAGVHTSDRGFYLLKDAVVMYLENDNPMGIKLKDVLSNLAKRYNISFAVVQRLIKIPVDNATGVSEIPLGIFIAQVVEDAKNCYMV